jgi:hypothetical protein
MVIIRKTRKAKTLLESNVFPAEKAICAAITFSIQQSVWTSAYEKSWCRQQSSGNIRTGHSYVHISRQWLVWDHLGRYVTELRWPVVAELVMLWPDHDTY